MLLTEVPIYGLGRVAVYKPWLATPTTFYEVSDHQGNVRGVIGDPETLPPYIATLEDNGQAVIDNPRVQELAYFQNLAATAVEDANMNHTPPSAAMPSPNYSSYLKWISGMAGEEASDKSIGPAIGLNVESGDKIDIETWVKFENKTSYGRSGVVGAMASILGNSFVGTQAGLDVVANASQIFQNGLTEAVGVTLGNGNDLATLPYAYVYYLLYDRSFNFITAGWKRVSSDAGFDAGMEAFSTHEKLTIPTVNITEPGYIYIFVSNESENTKVWFDDLNISHERSVIVAGADYYPFGLAMENREITREDYRWGYQGQYAERDTRTGWNQFELRFYDAKIARWLTSDPYGQYYSPYKAMGNTPHMGVDPEGGLFGLSAGWSALAGAGIGFAVGAGAAVLTGNQDDWWKWGAIGAVAGGTVGYFTGDKILQHGSKNARSVTGGKRHNNTYSTRQRSLKHPRFSEWQERVFDLAVESDQIWNVAKEYALQFERENKVKKLQFSFNEFWGSSGQWISRNGKEEMWDVNNDWGRLDTPIFGKRGTYRVTHYQIFPNTPAPTIMPDGTSVIFAATPVLDIKVTVRRQIHGRYGKTMSYGWKRIGAH